MFHLKPLMLTSSMDKSDSRSRWAGLGRFHENLSVQGLVLVQGLVSLFLARVKDECREDLCYT